MELKAESRAESGFPQGTLLPNIRSPGPMRLTVQHNAIPEVSNKISCHKTLVENNAVPYLLCIPFVKMSPTLKARPALISNTISLTIETVARNSSNALSSADFSLDCQVTIVDRHIGSRSLYW
jgi:hypothetical protein